MLYELNDVQLLVKVMTHLSSTSNMILSIIHVYNRNGFTSQSVFVKIPNTENEQLQEPRLTLNDKRCLK